MLEIANETAILFFAGPYAFLDNFYLTPVRRNGLIFPSVENAFQAAKETTEREQIRYVSIRPDEAKLRGNKCKLRDDWPDVKKGIMRDLLAQKFAPGTQLADWLLDTGDVQLVEGNTWHDNTWGDCVCGRERCRATGKNWLGELLMERRAELRRLDS